MMNCESNRKCEVSIGKPMLNFMAGASGSGKTTLVAGLLPLLTARGVRPAVIKHACHINLDEDVDSTLYLQSGAPRVAVISRDKLLRIDSCDREPTLEEVAAEYDADPTVDLILVEGYKNAHLPKIEVLRRQVSTRLYADPADLVCVVTDVPEAVPTGIPTFGFGEEEALVELIVDWYRQNKTD